MKKSLIALLVVLALIVTVSVFSVGANNDGTTAPVYTSDLKEVDGQMVGFCPHCKAAGKTEDVYNNVVWTAWANQTTAGHYYLTASNPSAASVKLTGPTVDVVLNLNGFEYTRAGYCFDIANQADFSVVDSSAGTGKIVNTGTTDAIRLTGGSTVVNWYSGTLEYAMPTGGTKVANGGCINLTGNGATVNMYSGTMKTSGVSGSGGVVYINTGIFNMHGGTLEPTITTAAANAGGAVYVKNYTGFPTSEFNMYGGTIKNFKATNGGAVYVASGTFKLDGGTIDTCSSPTSNGGAVYAKGGGTTTETIATVTIDDGKITTCSAPKGSGGGLYMNSNANLNINGGTIENCSSLGGGASLRFNSMSVTFNMTDGTITGGNSTSADGGGNFLLNVNSDVNITGGTFSNGQSGGNGGNIYIANQNNASSKFSISNTTVSGGSATGAGGNLYVPAAAREISNVTFIGGTATTDGGSVWSSGNQNFDTCTFRGEQTTTTDADGKSTTTEATGGSAGANGGNLYISSGTVEINDCDFSKGKANKGGNLYVAGGTVSVTNGTTINAGSASAGTNGQGGNIYTTQDLTISNATIKDGYADAYAGNIGIGSNKTLNITSSVIDGGEGSRGGAIYINSGCTVNLTDCEIKNCIGRIDGGNIRNAGGTLNIVNTQISGGVANGATAGNGGGNIFQVSGATNVYNDDTEGTPGAGENTIISGGKAKLDGGNVYIADGTFTLNGTLQGKGLNAETGEYDVAVTNAVNGGNVCVAGGTFTMNNGIITGGTAKTKGGNVYIKGADAEKQAAFTMDNGEITNGNCADNCGGVFVADYGTFTMNDGLLKNNDSVWSGGNIAVQSSNAAIPATLIINDGTISDGDSTKGTAGNLLISTGADATIKNADITGGTALTSGGNVRVEAGSVTFADCAISKGAAADGGNLCLVGGSVKLGTKAEGETPASIVTISEGTATATDGTNGFGGNIYTAVALDISNTAISGGKAVGTTSTALGGGGNIYTTANLTIPAGYTLSGGLAENSKGGNLYIDGGAVVTLPVDENDAEKIAIITAGMGYRRKDENFGSMGGNVCITNGELQISGGTVSGGMTGTDTNAMHGGNISIAAAGKLTMTSGLITDGKSGSNAGNIHLAEAGAQLSITGGQVTNGAAGNAGGNIHANPASGAVTLKNCEISGGTAGASGAGNLLLGAVTTSTEGVSNISKVDFVGGSAKTDGGNVYVAKGTHNFVDCEFRGEITQTTGENDEVVTVEGVGGNATTNGGNIFNQLANLTLTNCTVSNGKATGSGGNIYNNNSANAELTIVGGTISGGTAANGGNMYLAGGSVTFNENGENKVTISNGTAKRAGVAAGGYGGNIYNAIAGLDISKVTLENGVATYTAVATKKDDAITGVTIYGGGGGQLYTNADMEIGSLSGGTAINANGGTLYIGGGTVTLTGIISNGVAKLEKVDIDGDGNYDKTNEIGVNAYGGAVYVSNGTLKMADANSSISNSSANVGGGVALTGSSSVLQMENGTISVCSAPSGGAVYVQDNASAQLSGGTITGCSATNGGAVYAAGGVFTLDDGGIIENCYANDNGGALYAQQGELALTGGTIQNCEAQDYGGAVFVWYANGKITMTGGNIYKCSAMNGGAITVGWKSTLSTISGGDITECSATNNGGAIYVYGSSNSKLTMSGGNITDCEAKNGGSVCVQHETATFEMSNGTLTGGDVGTGIGGNIYVADGTLTMTGGNISGGNAGNGGNIYIHSAATAASIAGAQISAGTAINGENLALGGNIYVGLAGTQISRTEISAGVAGTKKLADETAGTLTTPDTNGRGGNIAILANTTLTNCELTGGESYAGTGSGGGGNIYIEGGDQITITSCKITGGFAYGQGGNIQAHSSTEGAIITIEGASYISEGISYRSWGGNVANTNGNCTTKILGTTVVNGKGSRCHATAQYGNNIAVVLGAVEIGENASVYGGKLTKGNEANTALSANEGISVEAGKVLTVSGNASIADNIFLRTKSTTEDEVTTVTNGILNVAGDFTGMARPTWQNTEFRNAIDYGMVLSDDAAATICNYRNKGSVLAVNNRGTGIPIMYRESDEKYQYTGFTAFQNSGTVDENGEPIYNEVPLATLADANNLENIAYIKLYVNDDSCVAVDGFGTITLQSDLPIDLNNQKVNFVTNNHTLKALDYRTDAGVVASSTKFTVDDPSKVELVTMNPTNGYYYLNIQEDDGSWSSNCVRIELKKVSLRPRMACTNENHSEGAECCGIYYTAKIRANAKAAACLRDYGIVAGLNPNNGTEIEAEYEDGTNFMTNSNKWWKWTCRGVDPGTDLSEGVEFNSGMIRDIMCTTDTLDDFDSAARGKADIDAKVYVTAVINGQEEKILSGDDVSYSVQDLANKLAEMYFEADAEGDTDTTNKIKGFLDVEDSLFGASMKTWFNETEPSAEFAALDKYYYPDKYVNDSEPEGGSEDTSEPTTEPTTAA